MIHDRDEQEKVYSVDTGSCIYMEMEEQEQWRECGEKDVCIGVTRLRFPSCYRYCRPIVQN